MPTEATARPSKLTKNQFESLLENTRKMIVLCKQDGEVEDKQAAELYGMYYNAFAGVLRHKELYRKEMDFDGYAKYIVSFDSKDYSCRDEALRDILKEDYYILTRAPFENESDSYVKPYSGKLERDDDETGDNTRSMNGRGNRNERASSRESERARVRQQNRELQQMERKNELLLKDARGYDYDPNYDHFYSDRLPEILKELDSSAWTIAARIVCIALASAGIIAALVI